MTLLEISIEGCRIWPLVGKIDKKAVVGLKISIDRCRIWQFAGKIKKGVSGLEISIDGCRIWPLAGKIKQNSLNVVSGLKMDGCMHPLPQIDGCSCTRRTRTNKGPEFVFKNLQIFKP